MFSGRIERDQWHEIGYKPKLGPSLFLHDMIDYYFVLAFWNIYLLIFVFTNLIGW